MAERFINISFPFEEDPKGKFLKMEGVSKQAVKADLLHLLLTQKRQRLYLPSFGIDLKQYLFEQNEGVVHAEIQNEIQTAINNFIPNLTITSLTVRESDRNRNASIAKLEYKVNTATFSGVDFVEIEL